MLSHNIHITSAASGPHTQALIVTMNTGRLLFRAPLDSETPSPKSLETHLRGIGLIGERYRQQDHAFLTGERFLQLVTFLGCSPFLRLEPADPQDEGFCQVQFLGPFAQPRLMYGGNTRPPRCPHCGKSMGQWRTDLNHNGDHIDCQICGQRSPVDALDWRRNAGLGRFFIQVTEVFPGEAVPLPALMQALREGGGDEWDYFYIQGSDQP